MTDGRKQIHTKRWNHRAAGDRSKRNQIKNIKKVRQMMEKFIVWRTFLGNSLEVPVNKKGTYRRNIKRKNPAQDLNRIFGSMKFL